MLLQQNKKYGFVDMVTLSFRTSVFYSIFFALRQLVDALIPTVSIFVNALFINNVIAVMNNQKPVSVVYPSIALSLNSRDYAVQHIEWDSYEYDGLPQEDFLQGKDTKRNLQKYRYT